MANYLNLGGIASAITRLSQRAYGSTNRIPGIDVSSWPNPGQPITPMLPDAKPLVWPFNYSQNLIYTPRPDAGYTAEDLRNLASYPLARICIDNTKDTLCQIPWTIELRKMPGESVDDVKRRRKRESRGDDTIYSLSTLFEYPDGKHDWAEWLRPTLEDMLVTDGASTLIQRNWRGDISGFEWTSGDPISVYIDERGSRPEPPAPAYAQTWQGMPRTDLTADQIVYKPRNIVPRVGVTSSYLYGTSPVESIGDDIKIGIGRLAYVLAYYDQGSMGNMIHVVPPGVPVDKIREAMQWVNSEMAGNNANRRQYRIIQGFQQDGKPDQLVFPTEPVLADVFDELHIRKICFAFGTSPQRLQRMMNRASAQASQKAAQDEGIKPWMDWVRRYVNYLIQVKMGFRKYEMVLQPSFEMDYLNKAKANVEYVKEGILDRNDIREELHRDPSSNPLAGELCVSTPNGTVKLGEVIVSGKADEGGDGTGAGSGKPPAKPAASLASPKPNGSAAKLITRGVAYE